ncbi:hypothetical protein CLAIMM_09425 [Cladophialophora immunda]|nr:hypothetical protein CLAIMM_09425 [Cladophialophora immunda]
MSQAVVSKGIFHGLPTFPEYKGKKLRIIVTGANGISGSAMTKVLSEAPERWEKIYALSRRPPLGQTAPGVEYIAADFLESTPEQIAQILKDKQVKAMNILWPLSIYAAVQAHLGLPLEFPGDVAAWDVVKQQSMSTLIAYHAEWALLTPEAGNQALNQCDDSAFAWGKFWPTLADWYDTSAGRPATNADAYATITMPYPISPRGFGGPGIVKASFSFLEWSKKPEVLQAWEELKEKHGLKYSPFGDKAMDTFGLIDGELLGGWGRVISMDRNRKLGWHGFVSTKEAIKQVLTEMADLKMVPPFAGAQTGKL